MIEQGTEEWKAERLGIATASEFNKILTSTGKKSTQADTYAYLKAAQVISGKTFETWQGNEHTERGNELEPEAVSYYEFVSDNKAQETGFILSECGLYGASPDRLIGDDGLLELKCPAPQTQVKYLQKKKVPTEYFVQVQGQLLVTGRKWCDFMSYHPDLPHLLLRVERDEAFIEQLHKELVAFSDKVKAIVDDIAN